MPSCAQAATPPEAVIYEAVTREAETQEIGAHRVGPNSVTQLIAALDAAGEERLKARVFHSAGCGRYLDAPPTEMVPEQEPAFLHRALIDLAAPETAAAIAIDAGHRTGAYVIANRIPAPARAILKLLPARVAAPMLAKAIARHAWTFCGSGAVAVRDAGPRTLEIRIDGNALATPGCPWHGAVFETLFRRLAGARARVSHPECMARGDAACRFEVRY